jgi:putative iron-dependent peroxidase
MPFGNAAAAEFGTYFIGYAADPGVIERMLQRMFVGEPAGNTDRILDFSTAVTGCLFFAPPADFLERPNPTPPAVTTDDQSASVPTKVPPSTRAPEAEAPASERRAATSRGSLDIGSLKRSSKS